ncbi:MAG: small basic protein [Puniceicoccales bacterium]|nr:small basic protein [Puniceicoccales bacterium]
MAYYEWNSERYNMSQHPSFRRGGSHGAKRSVLKRFERIELLRKRGQWKDGRRLTALPKTKPEV